MSRRIRRSAAVIAGIAGVLLVATGGWLAWRSLPYVPPAHAEAGPDPSAAAPTIAGAAPDSTAVTAELTYVHRYWRHRNTAAYGDLGATDCMNFTSQALHARGWPMTATWGHSSTLGHDAYTASWISSTAFMRWLGGHPGLATPLSDAHRDEVRVGDVAQFDWDASGDRDHTAIVSRIVRSAGGRIDIDVAEHSPSGLADSVDVLIAQHGGRGVIHYWHLRS